MPLYKELVDSHKVMYIAGGATQNSIRVAQWVGQTPNMTSYIGCVGKDDFGKQLATAAEKDGVRTCYMEDETAPTGTCAVLITNKERSLVANLSAANNYKIDHYQQPEIQKVVEGAQVYYSAGFFLTVSPDTMVAVGKHAAETNKYFMMNLSAPFLSAVFKEPMHQVLPYADVVFGNESEAAAFAEANDMAGKSIEEVAQAIAALPKVNTKRSRMVVITQGADPTIVVHNGEVQRFAVTPLPAEEIVDLNGAGDAFVGGFLAMHVKGKDLATCVEAGHFAAATIIRTSGCVLPATCKFSA